MNRFQIALAAPLLVLFPATFACASYAIFVGKDLTADDKIEAMARALVNRLLHEPTLKMKELRDGRADVAPRADGP